MIRRDPDAIEKEVCEMLKSVHAERNCSWLRSIGFFKAPASTQYHGVYPGGLAEHSLTVAKELIYLTKKLDLKWKRSENKNFDDFYSPIMIGILHDVCKSDMYSMPDVMNPGFFVKRTDSIFSHHAEKSIAMLLSNEITILNEEEVACIRWHMGAFEKDTSEWKFFNNAIKKYPNVLWTHTADMYASQIVGF